MTALALAIVAGLAGFWLWTVLNDEDGLFGFVARAAARLEMTRKWLSCPWCSGAWFSIAFSLILFHPSWGDAVITSIAAAAVCGALGSYFQGD